MAVGGVRGRKLGLTALVAAVAILALGTTRALAATDVTYTPSSNGSYIYVSDVTNDDDDIVVSVAANTITITDTGTGGITTADTDCEVKVIGTTVTCPLDPPDPGAPEPPNAPVGEMRLNMKN